MEKAYFKKTHGMATSLIYKTWANMKSRCSNPKRSDYKNYGGRGIVVCKRWLLFENFYEDMGDKPAGVTIERINNDGNYEPGNCKWADYIEQNNNNRHNLLLEYKQEKKTASEWARALHIRVDLIYLRLKWGWSVSRTLGTKAADTSRKFKKEDYPYWQNR